MSRLRYEVDVVGHRPPYKWAVFRAGDSSTSRYQVASGTSDGPDQAIAEAREAALGAEDERLHAATKAESVLLFEVDPQDPDGRIIDPEVRVLESWLDLGDHPDAESPQTPVHVTHDDSGFTD